MIKKLISISVCLGLVMTLGLTGDAGAAYNDVTFSTAEPIDLTGVAGDDLIISAGSTVEAITINASTVDMTLASGSEIIFTSATGKRMALNYTSVATDTCTATNTSSITVPYNASHPTVTLSLTGETCAATEAPVVSTMVVTDTTTVTVTFSRSIAYVADEATLIANTTFATIAPASSAISGADLVLTFTSALTGVKDDSVLSLAASQIRSSTDAKNFLGTTSQVITDLATINQLYDFVFVIQEGQNFMSVPFNVDTTLANSYVAPTGKTISIQTIGNASGNFANAISYSVLHGYYINSDSSTDVNLRLKKTSTPTLTFSRTFTAVGWHLIGMANNFVDGSEDKHTDDDVLDSIGTNYSTVLDVSTVDGAGTSNTNLDDTGNNGTYYNVGSADVYKSLYDANDIISSTYTRIEEDVAAKGIEFNTGEAYFIYISAASIPYIGTAVDAAQLIL